MKKKELLMESKAELIERARELDLEGRSKMTKEELAAEIEKALTRVEAARARRARSVTSATSRHSVSTKARRAIEERSRRRRELAESSRPGSDDVEDSGGSDEGQGRLRPSRATRRREAPPGLDALDLDGGSGSSGGMARKAPKPAPEPYISRVPEDRLSGGPLPKKYNKDRFVLLTRDPRWLFAYWEILPGTEEKVIRKAAEDLEGDAVRRILRIFDMTEDGEESSGIIDIQIHPGARSWYIHLPVAGRAWRVEIGFIGKSGRFYRIMGSNVAKTPRKSVSKVIDEQYRTLDDEFDEIFRLSGGALVEKAAAGFGGSAVPSAKRRRVEVPEEEAERWAWPFPTSGGLWSGLPYASGIPAVPPPPETRKGDDFFFWVNCELILYGGTQPTASVTVQGQPIRLRPDGTFTLRYALPDGKISLPVVATRADGKERRKAKPIVTRKTIR